MQKILGKLRNISPILILIVILIPSFAAMIKTGMFSTADFHLFRLHEFDVCIRNYQIPCRWSVNAGLGYGEPLFNFYGQLAYVPSEILHLFGMSLINSLKSGFIISIIGSAITMYYLAKKLFKDESASILVSLLYVYAPYRALDIWVRGALPEAMAFVIFPIILLSIEKRSWKLLAVSVSVLILTHNLSFIMFTPVMVGWIILRKYWSGIGSILFSVCISAYYILPVVFESKFIDIESTTRGYFDFHNHFATLHQLFISNFWGYGASVWGPVDGLSMSVGHLQWILPLIVFAILILRKQLMNHVVFIFYFLIAWIFLFLTHNKATLIWETLTFMKYIQFPWRLLGVIVFCFSLAGGYIALYSGKHKAVIVSLISLILVCINASFFKPDVWYKVDDSYYLESPEWDRQRTASIGDYWPNLGHKIPDKPSDGKYINYFPGWESELPPVNGLILKEGSVFNDTPIRKIGNLISIISLAVLVSSIGRKKIWTKKQA